MHCMTVEVMVACRQVSKFLYKYLLNDCAQRLMWLIGQHKHKSAMSRYGVWRRSDCPVSPAGNSSRQGAWPARGFLPPESAQPDEPARDGPRLCHCHLLPGSLVYLLARLCYFCLFRVCCVTTLWAKASSNLLQRTGGDHWGGRAQLGWRTFMMTGFHWILGCMRLEIWHKICLSGVWCLCTVLCTRSCACYYWIGCDITCDAFAR